MLANFLGVLPMFHVPLQQSERQFWTKGCWYKYSTKEDSNINGGSWCPEWVNPEENSSEIMSSKKNKTLSSTMLPWACGKDK
jgi:hypothetical protein